MNENWGIYVHVPWCRRRCPYCDFYFEVGRPDKDFSEQLIREFNARRPLWPNSPAATLYLGGGTPSLLPSGELQVLLRFLKSGENNLKDGAEITIEANPEDVSRANISDWIFAGVNRVSLGIQSFDNVILKKLGRKHNADEAVSAVESCLQAGIQRISVDLIFGVPGEDKISIGKAVKHLKDLGVGHISAYMLTVEPGTPLERQIQKGRSERPDDDKQADAYEEIQSLMADCGYRQYEVSSYCIPGQESRHNRNYWGKGPYLGIGPAAHSMRLGEVGSVERSKNKASIRDWRLELINPRPRDIEILPGIDAFLESVAFGLRDLLIGVNPKKLASKHHIAVPTGLSDIFARAVSKGWLVEKSDGEVSYHLSSLGVRFSDAVAREILNLA